MDLFYKSPMAIRLRPGFWTSSGFFQFAIRLRRVIGLRPGFSRALDLGFDRGCQYASFRGWRFRPLGYGGWRLRRRLPCQKFGTRFRAASRRGLARRSWGFYWAPAKMDAVMEASADAVATLSIKTTAMLAVESMKRQPAPLPSIKNQIAECRIIVYRR